MSDTEPTNRPPGPETQKQRWAKYGANVVLVSVIAVLLAVVLTAIAQRAKARIDTTSMGMYSLKPQTKAILRDLKQDVRIVSLYTQTKPLPGREKDYVDYATPVADLLDEYKRNSGGRIDVEVIDPTQNPSKVDDLITQVTERYGGEVKQYRDFLAGYDKTYEQLKKLATDETAAATAVDSKALQGSELGETVQLAAASLESTLQELEQANQARARQLAQKPPNYKGAVDAIESSMGNLSAIASEVAKRFTAMKDEPAAPDAVKKYAAEATPRYQELAKQATAVTDQVKKLGALKLDDLRQTLRARDGIVVMGPKDMRVLPFEQVWQADPNVRRMLNSPDKKIKPQFHGEQQITSAVLGLTQDKKPKVAFVRAGGPPLTTQGMFFGPPPGDLSRIAARLREYNFEVLEKDLTGMWAMQAQMQQRGMPPEPEPDDAAVKDAVWVVVASPAQQAGPMGPPPQIAPRVAEHLKAGGSALFLLSPQGEDLSVALGEYGIKARTDAVIVHEPITGEGGPQGDFINQARKIPFVFVLNEYGTHMLTGPLRSLDMPLVAGVPVSTEEKAGVKRWDLLPIPAEPRSWAETNIEALQQGEATFDAAADQTGPLFAGAAAQREQGEGRVVVLGNTQFAMNDMLRIPDRELLEQGYVVSRFPGSLELFTNSVFWLAKMEPMIAISPAAMDVSRIEPMSATGQWFWRNAVLLFGLPMLVVLAGGLMYVRRRD